MEKKFQIFISSTYTDLVEARTKVRDAILSMYHFPVGMELFSAADEEQWQIIQETIDSSDYYVLIIGQRYGSVIEDESGNCISYTEKEFRYAKECGIPVLVFLLDDDVPVKAEYVEKLYPEKLAAFKESVKNGRIVEWWKTTDELAQKVTTALYKQFSRKKRPGWIRGDLIDVEKSLNTILKLTEQVQKLNEENKLLALENQELKQKSTQKALPWLDFSIQEDESEDEDGSSCENEELLTVDSRGNIHLKVGVVHTGAIEAEYCTIDKKDFIAELRRHITDREIEEYNKGLPAGDVLEDYLKEYRYYHMVQDHGIEALFIIYNRGTAKATDVSLTVEFPDEILVLDIDEVQEMKKPKAPEKPRDLYEIAYERAHRSEISFEKMYSQLGFWDDTPSSIWPTILPTSSAVNYNESLEIMNNVVEIEIRDGIVHTKNAWFGGIYIVPLEKGYFKAKVTLMCAEYEKPENFELSFVCE